jgi:hypothetical protein
MFIGGNCRFRRLTVGCDFLIHIPFGIFSMAVLDNAVVGWRYILYVGAIYLTLYACASYRNILGTIDVALHSLQLQSSE